METEHSIISEQTSVKIYNDNTYKQFQAIQASGLLVLNESIGLQNPLCHKQATVEEQHDLLVFRDIRQGEFNKYIDYYILGKIKPTCITTKKKICNFL